MAEILLDENKLKDVLKAALLELLKEDKEIFYDLLTEVIEDIALVNAIKEGENTERVDKATIFKKLGRQP